MYRALRRERFDYAIAPLCRPAMPAMRCGLATAARPRALIGFQPARSADHVIYGIRSCWHAGAMSVEGCNSQQTVWRIVTGPVCWRSISSIQVRWSLLPGETAQTG